MSTQIVPFEFGGEQIRSLGSPEFPEFVAADVLAVLDLNRSSLSALDDDERGVHTVDTPGGQQSVTTITEPGLYSLVLRSRKAEAKAFKRWITREVIPAIRKTGSYSTPKTLEERTLELVGELHSKVQEQHAELVEIRPLASQARTFNDRKGNVGRQDFARDIIAWGVGNGYTNLRQKHVFEFMSGRKLDLFIHDTFRKDHGNASSEGLKRGLSFTHKDVSVRNGHAFAQGMLTPKGFEYAWSRIESYVREHGHLELPKKELAA